jgi:hypothetical protein
MFCRTDCQWSPSSNDTHTCVSLPAKSSPLVFGGIRISKALFRREEEYEMDLWVVKYASRRSRIGKSSSDSSVRAML